MRALSKSAGLFLWGVTTRFYLWAPAVLLDPFDYYDRYIKHVLPPEWRQQELQVPLSWFIVALTLGLVFAAILTYHELRMLHPSPDGALREKRIRLNAFLAEANNLKTKMRSGEVPNFFYRHDGIQVIGPDHYLAEWNAKVTRWIEDHMPEYAAYFASDNDGWDAETKLANYAERVRHLLLQL